MHGDLSIWFLFGLCLGLSFLFSGMEAGVFALSRLRIRQQMRAGRYSAKLLHSFLEEPENFLWTILVGNTLANFFIFGWLVAMLHAKLEGRLGWFIVAYALVIFLFYVVFDLLPKMLFRKYPNRLCIFLARPFRAIHYLLRPLVGIVEWVSGLLLRWRGGHASRARLFGNREELRLMMQESAQTFSSEEQAMINRVLDLQSLTVRQAMKPIGEAVTLSAGAPVARVLEVCREKHFTRLPVWDQREGRQRVVGLVSCNDLLFRPELDLSKTVAEHLRPALYLDEDLRLEIAMRRMQRAGQRLAIVLGEDRRETGIIGLQDVLRTMFGEVSL